MNNTNYSKMNLASLVKLFNLTGIRVGRATAGTTEMADVLATRAAIQAEINAK